jgi:hypothetical protein
MGDDGGEDGEIRVDESSWPKQVSSQLKLPDVRPQKTRCDDLGMMGGGING